MGVESVDAVLAWRVRQEEDVPALDVRPPGAATGRGEHAAEVFHRQLVLAPDVDPAEQGDECCCHRVTIPNRAISFGIIPESVPRGPLSCGSDRKCQGCWVRREGTLVVEVEDPEVQASQSGESDEVTIKGPGLPEMRFRLGQFSSKLAKDATPEPVLVSRGQTGCEDQAGARARVAPKPAAGAMAMAMAKPPETAFVGGSPAILSADPESAWFAVFAPDGKLLATSDPARKVRLWDPATGQEQKSFDVPLFVRSIAFASDGKSLALAGTEGDGRSEG